MSFTMRQHKSEQSTPMPWHVPVAAEDVPETGTHFELVADAHIRAAVARIAELRELARLEANFDVSRHAGGGLRVAGRISATVGQTCVVTLEPLANEVAEEFDLVFMPQTLSGQDGEDEAAREEKREEAEPLIDGRVDLGALATEFLILGLDPYPRKAGAVFQPPQPTTAEEGPFAALAALKKDRDAR
jgi:Large ribosomal RNA subunit accumulation protein YceD